MHKQHFPTLTRILQTSNICRGYMVIFGKVILNCALPVGEFDALKVPPCADISAWARERPIPKPVGSRISANECMLSSDVDSVEEVLGVLPL